MNSLIVNCITDWTSGNESQAFISFDELFAQFQKRVNRHYEDFQLSGELEKIYVQFQYDCSSLPNTVSGIKISRYSKKHKDIQAYIEITQDQYHSAVDEEAKLAMLKEMLIHVFQDIAKRLTGKIDHNMGQLIDKTKSL